MPPPQKVSGINPASSKKYDGALSSRNRSGSEAKISQYVQLLENLPSERNGLPFSYSKADRNPHKGLGYKKQ